MNEDRVKSKVAKMCTLIIIISRCVIIISICDWFTCLDFWQKIDMLLCLFGLIKKSKMVSTRNMIKNSVASSYKSLRVEIVPYVYQAGDDDRRQPAKPQERRRSPRLAALRPKAEAPSYKSIIRTRAQKLKDHQAYLDSMFTNIDTFYNTRGYEPSAFSDRAEEAYMGAFVRSLRSAHSCDNLGGQAGVDLVKSRLPWFKFEEANSVTQWSKRTFSASDVALMGFLVAVLPALLFTVHYLVNSCYLNDQCPSWATNSYASVRNFADVTGAQLYSAGAQLSAGAHSIGGRFLNTV